jgi:hypothetical protein
LHFIVNLFTFGTSFNKIDSAWLRISILLFELTLIHQILILISMNAIQSSIHKMNLALRFFVWANRANEAILGKLPNNDYKAWRIVDLLIDLVQQIAKVTITDTTAPIPITSIHFILNGCFNEPIVNQTAEKRKVQGKNYGSGHQYSSSFKIGY